MSKSEDYIVKILKKENIKFEREKSFIDLHNYKYRYDFYLPQQNTIIEVHGLQHYVYSSFFYKNRIDFMRAQGRDREKISYALAHKINLYAIPYWELNNIKNFKDIIQNKYLCKSKWHIDKTKVPMELK